MTLNKKSYLPALALGLVVALQACGNSAPPPVPVAPPPPPPPPPAAAVVNPTGFNGDIILQGANELQADYGNIFIDTPFTVGPVAVPAGQYTWAAFYQSYIIPLVSSCTTCFVNGTVPAYATSPYQYWGAMNWNVFSGWTDSLHSTWSGYVVHLAGGSYTAQPIYVNMYTIVSTLMGYQFSFYNNYYSSFANSCSVCGGYPTVGVVGYYAPTYGYNYGYNNAYAGAYASGYNSSAVAGAFSYSGKNLSLSFAGAFSH